MTIDQILSDEALRQEEFPVTRSRVFLAHAGVCPLPRRVASAMAQAAMDCSLHDQEAAIPARVQTETRELAARLIGARPEEIALVGPTSVALSLIANGLRMRKGDNVLVYLDDYPSNVYPWMAMAERGVQVRLMNIRELGRIRVGDVLGQVDEQTRLVALSSCHFVSGWRPELEAIGAGLHERNIPFSVDGIQTLGTFPMDARHFDFMAADSHKWMLGPCGAGILYVRKEVQDWMHPTLLGWHNVKSPQYVTADKLEFRRDARRYEAGTADLVNLCGLRECLRMLLELGVENIATEVGRKRSWLVPRIQDLGYTVLQPSPPAVNAGGILSFYKPGGDMPAIHAKLEAASIITSLRCDRAGNRYIRLSPHFYNTEAELGRFLALLKQCTE